MLLLSNHVGSRYDFAMPENAVLFNPDSEGDFARGFDDVMNKSDGALLMAQKKSLELGQRFSPDKFAYNLTQMILSVRDSYGRLS